MKRTAIARAVESLAAVLIALRLSPLMAMLLGCLGALLLAAFVFVIRAVDGPDLIEQPPNAEWRLPNLAAAAHNQAKPASADVQTLTRPIFAKSRRPSPKSQEAESERSDPTAPPPAGLALAAIAKFRNVEQAFIVANSFPEGKWLGVGEQVEGWTIADMNRFELTLKNGERSVRLQLYPTDPQPPPKPRSAPEPQDPPEPQ